MASLVLFALVLVIVGGLIAWLGDWLGTRIGKKRLSIFGLRPRHTATLLTIASGVGIALVTLLTLIFYDYGVRRALLHGQEIFDANTRLRHQNTLQQTQLNDAAAKLSPVLSQLTASRGALYQSQQILMKRQQRLDQAQTLLSQTQNTLAHTHAEVVTARASLHIAQQQVAAAQSDVRRLTHQGDTLAAQNQRLRDNRLALLGRAVASRLPLLYRTGQEVGRIVVPTGQPVAAVQRQLTAFLTELGTHARRRGGLPGNNGRAVAIAVPADAGEYRALAPPDEKGAVHALAQNIAGAERAAGSVVVVAQVAYNAFVGEQTDLELRPYDNVLVYRKDAVVASETLDGSRPDADIVSALQEFLTSRVRPAALHDGLIPQTDPQTGRPVVGAIDQETSLALVHQIASLGGPVHVTAYASENIFSAGPLRLRLSASRVGL